ncbi:MAG: uroporphyrinogen-III synthase [Thaumarchaeota archaeon]|nr:uroporphyrinogen-III synthase [Nitrososphaerota archaeon]
MLTRPKEKNAEVAKRIRELGGTPIEIPVIETTASLDYDDLDNALSSLPTYQWMVFTSANGVEHFFKRALEKDIDLKVFSGRVAAVGPVTAAALEARGLRASFIPSSYLTEKLGEEMPSVPGERILLVRAEGVDETMSTILKRRGATVHEVYAYRVQPTKLRARLRKFDAIVFSSPSAVRGFTEAVDKQPAEISKNTSIWCIGPVTAKAAQNLGYRVHTVAKEHTTEGLLKELVAKMEDLLD